MNIPIQDINQIEPENIASIEVLRDVASSAQYGIRGGSGVININTKGANTNEPLHVQLHSFVSTENIARRLPFADAETFVAAGGENGREKRRERV